MLTLDERVSKSRLSHVLLCKKTAGSHFWHVGFFNKCDFITMRSPVNRDQRLVFGFGTVIA